MVIDLDHFKAYTDANGHHEGDALLRTVSAGWTGELREADLLARLGGDEFAVLLPATGAGQATALCERLFATLPEHVSVSAGIAEWDGTEDQSGLYRRCDQALYRAKRAGRGQARLAS